MEKLVNVGSTQHYTRHNHERKWVLVDAEGQSLGRLATTVATLLRGKHKPTYTRHDDVGDFVVVINADKVELRGNNKVQKKLYRKHTGWFGHLREFTAAEVLAKKPELVVQKAVYGMIPSGALCNRMMKKLKIYAGPEHPHKAQNPERFDLSKVL
jgi:large subunit ribosomal protein L13